MYEKEKLKLSDPRARELFGQTDPRLLERFKKFHDSNLEVYRTFCEYAARIKDSGREKYSHVTICNVIRWEYDLKSKGETFILNNDFMALYARLLMYHKPEYEEFFNLRAMKPFNRRLSGEDADRGATL